MSRVNREERPSRTLQSWFGRVGLATTCWFSVEHLELTSLGLGRVHNPGYLLQHLKSDLLHKKIFWDGLEMVSIKLWMWLGFASQMLDIYHVPWIYPMNCHQLIVWVCPKTVYPEVTGVPYR